MPSSPERGELGQIRVPKLLYLLHSFEKNGVLLIERNGLKKSVFFREGKIVESRSNALADTLGQMLLRAGKIPKEALDDTLALMEGTDFRQGDLLVRMGFLTGEECTEWLERQLMERIWGAFRWTSGQYQFLENQGQDVEGLPRSALAVIHEGIYGRLASEFLRRELGAVRGHFYAREESLDRVKEDVSLSLEERNFFLALPPDGKFEDVLKSDRLEEALRHRFIYFCLQSSLIESAADKGFLPAGGTSRRLAPFAVRDQLGQTLTEYNDKNFYEVLGVPEEATAEQIKNAYFALAAQYHPDRFSGHGDQTRQLAEQIFTHVNTAFSTLSVDTSRQAYDATYLARAGGEQERVVDMQAIVNAQVQYSKGLNYLKRKEYAAAVKAFSQALELHPHEPDYMGHLGWGLFKENASPAAKDRAKQLLRDALQADPKLDWAYVYLGHVHKAEGHSAKAQQQFELALKHNADNLDALREMRMTTVRKEKDQTVWKRLFKK